MVSRLEWIAIISILSLLLIEYDNTNDKTYNDTSSDRKLVNASNITLSESNKSNQIIQIKAEEMNIFQSSQTYNSLKLESRNISISAKYAKQMDDNITLDDCRATDLISNTKYLAKTIIYDKANGNMWLEGNFSMQSNDKNLSGKGMMVDKNNEFLEANHVDAIYSIE